MKKKNKKGFTIVEMVIVIAVIAILATTLVPTFENVITKAQESSAKQEAKNAYTSYMVNHAAGGNLGEFYLYETKSGKIVVLCNGAALGVYADMEEAMEREIPDGNPSLLFDTGDGKLWVYGAVPEINPTQIDLFVFAGQSNMMGAATLEPEVNTFTDKAMEYKYMPRLRGQQTGNFVSTQNPAGEFYYNDLEKAYGDKLNDLSYKSNLNNYSVNTYFCPAMACGTKSYGQQSEANMYPSATLAPYFVTEFAQYGHSSIYAHMAKGSTEIIHYFTNDMMEQYNGLITEYNQRNNTTHPTLTTAELSGAGDAFDAKYQSMVTDYATFAPNNTIKNKCFVWLQGESDYDHSYEEYKLKMEVLWDHLKEMGFTHFFVLRVGYWGSQNIINVIQAQEDFCAENENCYIVTRAPSLMAHPGATTSNWWAEEPGEEYQNGRDCYLVAGDSNWHFNERAFQLFAERAAENIHRILYLGMEPILEEENIKALIKAGESSTPEATEPEDDTPYDTYIGAEVFKNKIAVSTVNGVWIEKNPGSASARSTDLIPVKSTDSVWVQYVFYLSEAHAIGGFYDEDGAFVAPLYYKDFGLSLGGSGGQAAFYTPVKTSRVLIADIEAATGKKIAYVRFTAWSTSAGGVDNTEARIYHDGERK